MDHGIVHRSDRVVVGTFTLPVFGPHSFERRFFGHARCRCPCFDRRASPRGVDQSDRLAERFREGFSEEIAYGAEPEGAFGIAYLPFALALLLIPWGTVAGDGEEPDRGIHGFLQFFLHVGDPLCGAVVHVRLSSAQPHLSDEYVFDFDFPLLCLDCQCICPVVRRRGLDACQPLGVAGRFGSDRILRPGGNDQYLLVGFGPSPYLDV